ncbi:MAG TPA: cyanophycin synthetase [Polyangiaceae bacterium]|nr:cyanophycin synthetase [Polyangiaceae bacterium]
MEIRKINVLVGPNIWANFPVLEAWVDLGHFEDFPSNKLPGFNDRIMAWLPSMVEHRCSVGERGGFFKRMRDGTWLGHMLEHVSLELHSLSHSPVGYGRARETSERGVYKVVIECDDPEFGRACLLTARELILAAVDDRPFDLSGELKKLREAADQYCYGPSTEAIVEAARARGIPTIRLTEHNLVQLGYGKSQRRIWTAETDSTGAIAEAIAQDKDLTRKLLSGVGIPVPAGRTVTSAEDAWAAAEDLGLPVVVKPQDANHGRGVSIRIEDREGVQTAYQVALKEGSGVVVERFVPGTHYRVLVVGERAIAASGGTANQLLGDGISTVERLVELANQNPERSDDSAQPLAPFVLDTIALELLRRQGLEPKTVPEAGRRVLIRYNGDLTVDETARMHPEVAASCVLAAQTIGLDVAGIDVIAEDIGRPLERQGGAIIEVNSSPGLIMHLKPLTGKPQPVGEAIVNHLFKATDEGRVPLVAVTGTNGKTPVAGALAHMLAAAGRSVGRADSTGVHVRGRQLAKENGCTAQSARRVLINPFVDAIVLEVSEADVLDQGLAFDHCDVAVITNIACGDHLGKRYVDELTTIEKAIRAPLDTVRAKGVGVLNASDPAVVAMADKCRGEVMWFSRSPDQIEAHLSHGGRGVTVENDQIVLRTAQRREYVLPTSRLSCAVLGLPDMLLDNALTSVAAGWALGLNLTALRAGLEQQLSPAEGVLYEHKGRLIIVSRARNAAALGGWLQVLQTRFADRRWRCVVEPPRDWRIQDAQALGKTLSSAFARVQAIYTHENQALAEALETETQDPASRPSGPVTRFCEAVNQMLEASEATDSLFAQPASARDYDALISLLENKGAVARRVSGLVSVENCR